MVGMICETRAGLTYRVSLKPHNLRGTAMLPFPIRTRPFSFNPVEHGAFFCCLSLSLSFLLVGIMYVYVRFESPTFLLYLSLLSGYRVS